MTSCEESSTLTFAGARGTSAMHTIYRPASMCLTQDACVVLLKSNLPLVPPREDWCGAARSTVRPVRPVYLLPVAHGVYSYSYCERLSSYSSCCRFMSSSRRKSPSLHERRLGM